MASVRDSLSHKLKGFLFQITNHTEHSAADHMASHRHKTTVQNHTHTHAQTRALVGMLVQWSFWLLKFPDIHGSDGTVPGGSGSRAMCVCNDLSISRPLGNESLGKLSRTGNRCMKLGGRE